jgi:hypothetical protein
MAMKANKVLDLIHRVYDNVEMALWSILLTTVIFFIVFVVPILPAIRAQHLRVRTKEIAEENALYCEKLNMKAGTPAYTDCLFVLGDFRLKVERHIYEEIDF